MQGHGIITGIITDTIFLMSGKWSAAPILSCAPAAPSGIIQLFRFLKQLAPCLPASAAS
jgi:hypothetical protein